MLAVSSNVFFSKNEGYSVFIYLITFIEPKGTHWVSTNQHHPLFQADKRDEGIY